MYKYIRVLVSTSRSDFHNTDIPDLSERGTRSSLGSFPVIRAAVVMLWVPVWKAEESESQWAHSWCFMERMIDHRKWLTVSVLFITKESYKRKEVRKQQEVVLIFQLLSELPTYFRWRLAGSRLLSKVWLQHCSSNKWKEPLPPVFHECEGVRAFPGQIFHFGPWNMNKRKLSKFCFTLWRCCFGVCLVNMWQMRNQTSYGQQMIFIFFFCLISTIWQDVVVADSYFPKVKYVNVLIWCILLVYSLLWFIISLHQNWNHYN